MVDKIVEMIKAKRDMAKKRYLWFKERDGYSYSAKREHLVWRTYSN